MLPACERNVVSLSKASRRRVFECCQVAEISEGPAVIRKRLTHRVDEETSSKRTREPISVPTGLLLRIRTGSLLLCDAAGDSLEVELTSDVCESNLDQSIEPRAARKTVLCEWNRCSRTTR